MQKLYQIVYEMNETKEEKYAMFEGDTQREAIEKFYEWLKLSRKIHHTDVAFIGISQHRPEYF